MVIIIRFLIHTSLVALYLCAKVPKGWENDVCHPNDFKSIVSLYIKQGIRWRNPQLKAKDLHVKEFNKRKELFNGLLNYYCKDKAQNEEQILQFDDCFNIAFNVDYEVTDNCRKKIFLFAGDIKEADCSNDETKEGEEFRKCVTENMRLKNPNFDLFDHAVTKQDRDNVELSKWFKKRSLNCMRRVFHKYLDDLQAEYEWPIWGNTFYYE